VKPLRFISSLLVALTAAACDSTSTGPDPKYLQLHFVVAIDGDASAFRNDGYAAIVDGTQTVPLRYGSIDSLAVLPGVHTIELRRMGLATDLARPAGCT
jgi:hypothetical protein